MASRIQARNCRRWVKDNGEGLLSVLGYLKLEHAGRFDSILAALRSVVPSIRNIHIARTKIHQTETEIISHGKEKLRVQTPREYWGQQLLFDTVSGTKMPAHLISEGTLIVLGLLGVKLAASK